MPRPTPYKEWSRKNLQKGFSTIEMLLAFTVGILFLSAALMIAFSDPTLAKQYSLDLTQALALDTILDSNALATSTNKFGSTTASLLGNWDATVSGDHDDYYTNASLVTDISPCIKEITNTTSWDTLGSRSRDITFGTTLSSIDIARALGPGGCDPLPPSGWLSPETDNSATANVSGAENGTGIAIKMIAGKRYAFVTSNPTGGGTSKKEFTVIDVTDTNITSSDIKATLPADKGLLGIALAGDYAYVLQNDDTNQLRIIDIHDPTSPVMLPAQYALPNITCSPHPMNCQRKGRSIKYFDGYLYIGTGRLSGSSPELHIFCIADSNVSGCSPTTPVSLATLNVEHNINAIALKGTNAYLATSANYAELTVIDVSNKTSPQLPSDYTNININNRKFNALTTEGSESTIDGTSIFVLGKYAYLGREKASNSNEREFYVLDISNPLSITAVGSSTTGISSGGSYISSVFVQNKIAFISTTDSNQSMFVYDVSNPEKPQQQNSCGEINTSQAVTGISYSDNLVFLVHNQGSALLKIIYDNNSACIP